MKKIDYIWNKVKKRFLSFRKHPLTKNNPYSALYRYCKFNISQWIYPKVRIYNWIGGLKFYAQRGEAGIVANIYFKLFDYEDSMFLIHHLNEEELFVDIGANVGHYSLLAAGICNAEVIAFEPIPFTFEKLKRNIKLNRLTNKINSYNIGLGAENSNMDFTYTKGVMNSIAKDYDTNTVRIKTKKLDDVLINSIPVFIKIDVEGYEYFVLKGAENVLRSISLKYIIIEFNFSSSNFGFTNDEIFQLLLSYNFVPIEYDVERREMQLIDSYNLKKFNTIFVKKDHLK